MGDGKNCTTVVWWSMIHWHNVPNACNLSLSVPQVIVETHNHCKCVLHTSRKVWQSLDSWSRSFQVRLNFCNTLRRKHNCVSLGEKDIERKKTYRLRVCTGLKFIGGWLERELFEWIVNRRSIWITYQARGGPGVVFEVFASPVYNLWARHEAECY